MAKRVTRNVMARLRKRIKCYEHALGICWLCKQFCKWDDATIDHVVPLCCDGGNEDANLRLAHRACNTRRADGGHLRRYFKKWGKA